MNMLREFHLEMRGGRRFSGLITRQPTEDTNLPRYQPPEYLRLYRGKLI